MPDRPARRAFLTGLGIALAMPAIVLTPGLLMPVRVPFGTRPLTEADVRWFVLHVRDPNVCNISGSWMNGQGQWVHHLVRGDGDQVTRQDIRDGKRLILGSLHDYQRAAYA